jgi:hypothetical protein
VGPDPLSVDPKRRFPFYFLTEDKQQKYEEQNYLKTKNAIKKQSYRNCLNVYFQENDVSDLKLPTQTHLTQTSKPHKPWENHPEKI